MRVEDSALTPDVRAAQVRKGTRLPSETTKLSVSRSARSAVTRFVPSYPAFQVTPPYLMSSDVTQSTDTRIVLYVIQDEFHIPRFHTGTAIWISESRRAPPPPVSERPELNDSANL